MQNFDLTSEEIQELKAAHKSCKQKSDAYKINAVILLGSGWTLSEVVDALLLDEETLRNYSKRYKEGGLPTLLQTNYKGGQPKLPIEYFDTLIDELESSIYLTTASVCAFVKENFQIHYSISGMTALLHRLGYVYKKPKLVPSKANDDEQEYFLQEYEKFIKKKPENEAVFFIDGFHPTHNSLAAYGWIKKGSERAVLSNTGRGRLNIHGAMNAETLETTVIVSEDSVNTDSTIALFEALEKLHPLATVIHVILDNARYHFSAPVMEYVKNSKIKLIFLPPYSPELNLIERLWKFFKKKVLYNQYYESYTLLRRRV